MEQHLDPGHGRRRERHAIAALLLGTLGAWLCVLGSSRIGAVPRPLRVHWWLRVPTGSYAVAHVLVYLGVAAFVGGWWWLGARVREGWLTTRRLVLTFALWASPFIVGVPVFSRDVYSYVAQGLISHRGLNPSVAAPSVLGTGSFVQSVATVWQHTPSPYGPLLTLLGRLCATIDPTSLTAQVLVYRVAALAGLGVLSYAIGPLARHRGANPDLARWLVILGPLTIVSVVSTAHNDVFMLALLALGILAADRGYRRSAFVLLALAATIKLPAFAATAFLAWHDMVRVARRRRVVIALEAVVLSAATFLLVTLLAGNGWTWLSPSALKIPASLHVDTTPSVIIGSFFASLLHVAQHDVVAITQAVFELLAVLIALYLLSRLHQHDYAYLLGLSLVALTLLSPTLWPWYFLWGLAILALTPAQSSPWLALFAGGAMFLVGPGGTPLLGLSSYYVTAPLLALAALRWLRPRELRALLREAERD